MNTDSSSPLAAAPRPDWRLPSIVDIKIRRIRFEPRKPRNFKSSLSQFKKAIEFMVKTSGPVPARALGPVLFVGDAQVTECSAVGREGNNYRFLSFVPQKLSLGAPISWGWVGASKKDRQSTKFRYRLKA